MKYAVKLTTNGTGRRARTVSMTVTYAPKNTSLAANAATMSDVSHSGCDPNVRATSTHVAAAPARGADSAFARLEIAHRAERDECAAAAPRVGHHELFRRPVARNVGLAARTTAERLRPGLGRQGRLLRVDVLALAGENVPVIEAGRIDLEVPFADKAGLIAEHAQ